MFSLATTGPLRIPYDHAFRLKAESLFKPIKHTRIPVSDNMTTVRQCHG